MTRMLFITIPKSGTHILNQATTRRQYDNLPWGSMIYEPVPNEQTLEGIYKQDQLVARTHVSYHPLYELALRDSNTKAIFLYRDPRDMLVSYYEWVKKLGHGGASIPGLIDDVGDFLDSPDPIMEMLYFWGEHVRRYIPWMFVPDVMPLKFEELVANKEGVCQEIIDFWGTSPYGNAEAMASRIKPSTSDTFRKGVVGDWRNYFQPHHIEEFNNNFYKTMKVLGYEL